MEEVVDNRKFVTRIKEPLNKTIKPFTVLIIFKIKYGIRLVLKIGKMKDRRYISSLENED